MRFKKVLLVNPLSHEISIFKRRTVLRAGIGYLAQALYDNKIDYEVFDFALGHSIGQFVKKTKKFKPDIIGFSLFTYRYKDSYNVIKIIKNKFKNIPIVVGGPHVTTLSETILQECLYMDFAIISEGEMTLVQLCKGANFSEIAGLIYRENDKIICTGARPYVENLDGISFPRYHNFELENYPMKNSPVEERIIPIVTSRGCPYNCTYCPVKTVIGRKFRYRSVASMIEELVFWYNMGYRKFSFADDNFTLIRDRVWQLCEAIESRKLKGLIMSCPNGIRADKTDYELLKKMFSVGFRYLGFGVEGGNNKILKNLKKGENLEEIERAVKDACDIGYLVDLYFLVGSPTETEADVRDSIALSWKFPVDNVFFFNLIPYPKTELFDWVKQHNYFLYPPDYYLNKIHSNMDMPVFATPEFPASARKKMLNLARTESRKFKIKKYVEQLKRRNVTGPIAHVMANLYATNFMQRLFNDIYLLRKIKSRIK